MRRNYTRRTLHSASRTGVALALAVATLNCAEPFGPGSVAGSYAATAVNGAPLPFDYELDDGAYFRLIADTLLLRRDGTGLWIAVRDEASHADSAPQRSHTAVSVRIVERGQQLRLLPGYGCGPLANCLGPQSHLLTPVSNQLYLSVFGSVVRFQRVDEAP